MIFGNVSRGSREGRDEGSIKDGLKREQTNNKTTTARNNTGSFYLYLFFLRTENEKANDKT